MNIEVIMPFQHSTAWGGSGEERLIRAGPMPSPTFRNVNADPARSASRKISCQRYQEATEYSEKYLHVKHKAVERARRGAKPEPASPPRVRSACRPASI